MFAIGIYFLQDNNYFYKLIILVINLLRLKVAPLKILY